MRLPAAMDEQTDKEIAGEKQRDQMLKLVAKGFYNDSRITASAITRSFRSLRTCSTIC